QPFRAFALMMRALIRGIRGNGSGARADANETLDLSLRVGWPVGVAQARWALGVTALSEGDAETAAATLDPVASAIEAGGVYRGLTARALPDAIEAFVATGTLERADQLTSALADWGGKFDRPWARATSGRCRALLDGARGDLDGAVAAAEQALVA